jgi:hypothetical protein
VSAALLMGSGVACKSREAPFLRGSSCEEYVLPVLMGFNALAELLTPELEAHLTPTACTPFLWQVGEGTTLDVETLVSTLERKGAASLARSVRIECAQMEQEMAEEARRLRDTAGE